MSLFPVIPQQQNLCNTMLASPPTHHNAPAQQQKLTTSILPHTPTQQPATSLAQLHNPHIHNHIHIRQHLASALSHISHLSSPTSPYRLNDYATRITVEDEFVLLEEMVEDGGPICREAEVESWKVLTGKRKRRLSVHCFGK
jgi:hypothetical protein